MATNASARRVVLLTKSATAFAATNAVMCGTAGTANITDAEGNDRDNYPLQQGENNISIIKLRSGGTCDNVWAMYS